MYVRKGNHGERKGTEKGEEGREKGEEGREQGETYPPCPAPHSRYPDRLEGGIVFIPFPKPGRSLEKARRWIRLCGRPLEQLNEEIIKERAKAKHLFVCSKHFVDGVPSERYPDPMSALSHEKITPCRKRPTQRDYTTNTFSAPTCKKRLIDTDMSCTLTQGELVQGPLDSLAEKNIDVSDVENIDPIEDKSFYGVEPLDMLAMAAENKALTENYAKLVLENVNLQQQLSSCKKKKKEKSIIIEKSFGCEKLNSKEYQYYTGFSKDRFEDILIISCA
ncbi:Hypothetical predicted protein [Mytilus galloprovincialis]|uniref:THAP-type domain-containing protein n=1 Tax=Mytilus galloprovincialis TaxID=29158 RepID=A0A8B6GSE4_MYTGA|nr:Hypothetical predicted protein [Mytilus galloprovincialis]